MGTRTKKGGHLQGGRGVFKRERARAAKPKDYAKMEIKKGGWSVGAQIILRPNVGKTQRRKDEGKREQTHR